jgi:hypothetical protein
VNHDFKKGDRVELISKQSSVDAVIVAATPNGKLLFAAFDGYFDEYSTIIAIAYNEEFETYFEIFYKKKLIIKKKQDGTFSNNGNGRKIET